MVEEAAGTAAAAPRSAHEHHVADPASWPWLPTHRGGAIVAHPYCRDCGLVKAVGAERPLDLGGLVNLLARLRDRLESGGHWITEAQRRLILRRLEAQDATDAFGQTRARQYALLCEAVGYYMGLPPDVVHSYLHHC